MAKNVVERLPGNVHIDTKCVFKIKYEFQELNMMISTILKFLNMTNSHDYQISNYVCLIQRAYIIINIVLYLHKY